MSDVPRIVTVDRPNKHYTLIRNPHGHFLGIDSELGIFSEADDRVIWEASDNGFIHLVSGKEIIAADADDVKAPLEYQGHFLGADAKKSEEGVLFSIDHGPADIPSRYLASLRKQGWVCIPSVLPPEIVDSLEKVSCTGAYESQTLRTQKNPLLLDGAVARTLVEPVSLWVIRQYLQSSDVRLAHPPGFSILSMDDGKCDVQGWHSDFPYLWGIGTKHKFMENRIPEHSAESLVMGVQRNICISDFNRDNGATIFKLGSHTRGVGPPREWGNGATYIEPGYREKHGLPYDGAEADLIEAPSGSIIVYDARTWHRAGVNRTQNKRAAMLQAMVPMYIMPFYDTSVLYKDFIASPLLEQLDELERSELEEVLVSRMGQVAITADVDLI